MIDAARTHVLLVRVGGSLGALPIADVVETMRPLPMQAVSGLPPFVSGVAVVRGTAIPVVDLSRLVAGRTEAAPGRFVTVRLGDRSVALAVEAVVGVREIDAAQLRALPPLLGAAGGIAALSGLDDRLLMVLAGSRTLLEDVERALEARGAP